MYTLCSVSPIIYRRQIAHPYAICPLYIVLQGALNSHILHIMTNGIPLRYLSPIQCSFVHTSNTDHLHYSGPYIVRARIPKLRSFVRPCIVTAWWIKAFGWIVAVYLTLHKSSQLHSNLAHVQIVSTYVRTVSWNWAGASTVAGNPLTTHPIIVN